MIKYFLFLLIAGTCFISCVSNTSNNNNMPQQQQIKEELTKINRLLRDTAFALTMAGGQEAAFYKEQGQTVPDFFPGPDSLLKKIFKEEKIAVNLAGFYAVECGVAVLTRQKGKTPVYWLQQIVNRKLDSVDALLLNRFANATWKASQPFRGLDRITHDNFMVFDFLSTEEIQKDANQVNAAAALLFDSLKNSSGSSKEIQFEKIGLLLKDKKFAITVARYMEAAYYTGQNKPVPEFLSVAEDTTVKTRSARLEKIAINIAGFYALECGLSYLSNTQHKLPSVILKSITTDSLSQNDKELLERFANATWKTGQPFRGLDRITRDIFMPFDLLTKEEVEKDWVQIKTAAARLQQSLL